MEPLSGAWWVTVGSSAADATAALARLYDVMRLHSNLFQPSFKLKEGKDPDRARVIKRYHAPIPPAMRVLFHGAISNEDKERLRQTMQAADPVMLFSSVRAAQEDLGNRVDRRGMSASSAKPVTVDFECFAVNLAVEWQPGETRLTHRRPYRRTKPYLRRRTMLEPRGTNP